MQWKSIGKAEVVTGSGFFGANGYDVLLSRASVPGGWLVLAVTPTPVGATSAITFYPDPEHAWQIEPPPKR